MARISESQARGRSKKLREAAQRWAGRGTGDPLTDEKLAERERELRDLGTPESEIKAFLDQRRPYAKSGELAILEANTDAVVLFQRLGTQWELVPMSGFRKGISYPSVKTMLELMDLWDDTKKRQDTFWRFQVMEQEAVRIFAENEQRRQRRRKSK